MTIYRAKPIIADDEYSAVKRVLDSGIFVKGPEVKALEAEFASYCGVKDAIALNSGTSALELAVEALNIGPSDEVITAPNSFMATANAVETRGAKAVFADVDQSTFNIDPDAIRKLITPKTKAIIPVHLYGQCADMGPIMEIAQRHDLAVIEDSCQSHGAKYKNKKAGSIGTIGCFSFFPTKNMMVGGDGGITTTSDPEIAERLRMLRNAGRNDKDQNNAVCIGHNYRLSEILAAIGRVQLKKLDAWNTRRRELANIYSRELSSSEIVLPIEAQDRYHIYHLYTIRAKKRNALMDYLKSKDIKCDINYPVLIPLMPAYSKQRSNLSWPNAQKIVGEILSIPMYPALSEKDVLSVSQTITDFLKRN